MFQSLFGCGVVCGLVVEVLPPKCGKVSLTVGAGVAIDCDGDPIYVPKDQTFVLDEKCDASLTGTLWVVLCPWVKNCAPRTPMCPSDDDDDESPSIDTRQRDGFDLRVLRNQPACACHCEPEESDKPGGEDASVNASVNETDGGSTLPVPEAPPPVKEPDCNCVVPSNPCYAAHYDGKCACACADCSDGAAGCDCVVLARLTSKTDEKGTVAWTADHSVRRFIRPVLMRDPQVAKEKARVAPKIQPANPAVPAPPPPPAQGPIKAQAKQQRR